MTESLWMRHGVDTDIGVGAEKGGRVAVGPGCSVSAERGIALGLRAACAVAGLAVGVDARVRAGGEDTSTDGIAVGRWANAYHGIAIGQSATGEDAIAIGGSAYAGSAGYPWGGLAVGRSAYSSQGGVAVGDSASATIGTALGRSSYATGEDATSLGRSSYADDGATAVGKSSSAEGMSVAIGASAYASPGSGAPEDAVSVAIGPQATAGWDDCAVAPARLILGVTGSARTTFLRMTDSDGNQYDLYMDAATGNLAISPL